MKNSRAPISRESLKLELTSCVVDLDRAVLRPRGTSSEESAAVPLTTRECELLVYLARRAPAAVSRDELLEHVFGFASSTLSRACDNTVRRLREKIEVDASRPDHLLTVHGTGYRLALGETAAPVVAPATQAPVRVDLVLGDVTVDLGRQRVYGPEGEQPLTSTESLLLARLLRASGEVVDRLTLVRDVWKQGSVRGREVDNAIRRLRSKIETDPSKPTYLLTAIGDGYRLLLRQTSTGRPTGSKMPPPRDRYVGRVPELEGLEGLLAQESPCRLVSLQGPVGMGKSRLALEALRRLEAQFSGGVWAVDLGAASSELEVCAIVGSALGLQGTDVERIGRVLGARGPALVLLDNLDGVAPIIGDCLDRWLSATPDPKFLLTSQQRLELGARGVERIVVGSLSVQEGAALLEARGVRVDADPEAAARLVEVLDGLPLALELAAARARILSTRGLLTRLEGLSPMQEGSLDRFRLLGDGGQRGLLASLEASFALLSVEEREAAARVSVFEGSFSLEAALAVLGSDGLLGIELIEALVDHSLLGRFDERFQMLASVRACAGRHLTESSRQAALQAHGAFFAVLGSPFFLERSEHRDGKELRARLKDEQQNLLVAATRAHASGDPVVASDCLLALVRLFPEDTPAPLLELLEAVALREPVHRAPELALALAGLFHPRYASEKARYWSSRAVALAETESARLRGRALRTQGVVVAQLDGFEHGAPLFEGALREALEAGDRPNQGAALSNLGLVARSPEEQIRYQTEALDVLLSCDPRRWLGVQLDLAVQLFLALRIGESREILTKTRMTALGADLPTVALRALANLARLELVYGTAAACESSFQQLLALARDHGSTEAEHTAWLGLSALYSSQGRFEGGEAAMQSAFDLLQGRMERVESSMWFDLSILRRQQRRFSEARQCIEHLEPMDPELASYVRAELAMEQEPGPKSERQLESTAAQLLGDHPLQAWFLLSKLAMVRILRDEIEGAEQLMAHIEADPRLPLVRDLPGPGSMLLARTCLRGYRMLQRGDPEGAAQAGTEALHLLTLRGMDFETSSPEHVRLFDFVLSLQG